MIVANLDYNIVRLKVILPGLYDCTVRLIHVSSSNILLFEKVINKELFAMVDGKYESNISFLNPVYTANLEVEIEYGGVVERVRVLGIEYDEPVSNPIRYPEHEENEPVEDPQKPEDNVVIEDQLIASTLFEISNLEVFNQNTNLLGPESFLTPPTIEEVGFIKATSITGGTLSVRLRNTQFTGPFPDARIIIGELDINPYAEKITFSLDVEYIPDYANPLSGLELGILGWYNDNLVDDFTKSYLQPNVKTTLSITDNISNTVNRLTLFVTASTQSEESFLLKLYRKSLVLGSTDTVKSTGRTINIGHYDLPYNLYIKTPQIADPGKRGLLDSTTGGANGLLLYIIRDTVYLEVRDSSGSTTGIAYGSAIGNFDIKVELGSIATLMLNSVPVGSVPAVAIGVASIGSIYYPNTALNSTMSLLISRD